MSPNQWWCGDTRIVLWSRRCRSWSRGWWVSGRYSALCYCGLMRAGFSSRPCVNPSSTSWWFARPAAAHSPPCGWKHTECGAFVAHWDPHLRDRKHNEGELAAECASHKEKHWTGGMMTDMVFPTYMSGFWFIYPKLTNGSSKIILTISTFHWCKKTIIIHVIKWIVPILNADNMHRFLLACFRFIGSEFGLILIHFSMFCLQIILILSQLIMLIIWGNVSDWFKPVTGLYELIIKRTDLLESCVSEIGLH